MTIIYQELDDSATLRSHYGSHPVKFKIDPSTVHETPLPGNHLDYSCVLGIEFEKWINYIQNFKVRSDDVWIVGLPKTGTTWMHNIVYRIKNSLDYGSIAEALEHQYFEKDANLSDGNFIERLQYLDNVPSPRIFKTHLPAFLLPKELWTVKPKIIYTARNPKDTALSGYHMMRNGINPFTGTIDDFSNGFLNEFEYYNPFFDHIRGFLQLRQLDHVLFTVYEDLLSDQFNGIKRVSDFLESAYSDERLLKLTENVSFKKMRNEFPSFLAPEDKSKMPDPSYK